MMLAWFKASLITASCSSSKVSNRPPFASKQDEYRIVSSIDEIGAQSLLQLAMHALCAANEAHRCDAIAEAGSASCAAFSTAGWFARPR